MVKQQLQPDPDTTRNRIAQNANYPNAVTTWNGVIGEIVMEGLQSIDSVAYVRFASVYKNFRETKDFEEFLGVISSNKE